MLQFLFLGNYLILSHFIHPTHTPTPHQYYTSSQVYLGRYKDTGVFCVIKVLQKKVIVKCSKVKHIMAKRNHTTHPFIVGLHYSFQTSTNLYFVLDYVNGGPLLFHLEREKIFDEPRARWVTITIIGIRIEAMCRIGQGKHQKACKQEIWQEHKLQSVTTFIRAHVHFEFAKCFSFASSFPCYLVVSKVNPSNLSDWW